MVGWAGPSLRRACGPWTGGLEYDTSVRPEKHQNGSQMLDRLTLLLLDAVVLAALLLILGRNRLRQAPRAGLVGLGLALTWLVCRSMFGWLIVLPLMILTAAVLMAFGRLSLKRAALATVIFLVVRVVLGAIIARLL